MKKYTVIWDLDGTLYEDEHHFDYYMEQLAQARPERDAMWQDYHAILAGRHPLRLGLVYDVNRDLILKARNGHVSAAWSWDGAPQPVPYTEPVSFNMTDMLSIGDQWWVAGAVAKHYGVKPEESQRAFLATRQFMMTPAYTVSKVPWLKETLNATSHIASHILLTNSPERDSRIILDKLGLIECFEAVSFLAHKPTRSKEHFTRAIEQASAPHLVISVGDNYENEIAPALHLGCQAIFIDRLNLLDEEYPGLLKAISSQQAAEKLRTLLV